MSLIGDICSLVKDTRRVNRKISGKKRGKAGGQESDALREKKKSRPQPAGSLDVHGGPSQN
jgi:hypothetical protein